jgi:hypothetical protein
LGAEESAEYANPPTVTEAVRSNLEERLPKRAGSTGVVYQHIDWSELLADASERGSHLRTLTDIGWNGENFGSFSAKLLGQFRDEFGRSC